jgi:hypothetical protein
LEERDWGRGSGHPACRRNEVMWAWAASWSQSEQVCGVPLEEDRTDSLSSNCNRKIDLQIRKQICGFFFFTDKFSMGRGKLNSLGIFRGSDLKPRKLM